MNGFLDRCARYRESLCLLASSAMTGAEQAEIETHLVECAECRRYHDEIRNVTAPLKNWEQRFAQIEPNQATVRQWQQSIRSVNISKPNRQFSGIALLSEFWRDWIRPFRFAWSGMAALWLIMAGMNFGLSRSQPTIASLQSAPTPAMVQSFEEQRRLLVELVSPPLDPIALPAHQDSRPRSERPRKRNSAQLPSKTDRPLFVTGVCTPLERGQTAEQSA